MVDSGLLKIKKKDPVKTSILRTPPHLTGSIFVFGRIRSGKTASILSLAGMYADNPQRRYKIFDIWGGDRNEHLFWALPSDKKEYWRVIKKAMNLDGEGPKQYKVNLLYPVMKSKMPKKFPFNPPNVYSKFFTIPIKEVTAEDMALIIGTPSDSAVGLWKDILYETQKKESVPRILNEYEERGGESHILYKNVLKPLSRELLFQDSKCIYNADNEFFKKEINDNKTISVLCLDYVDKEYKLFIMGYFLRKISEELDRRRRHTIEIIREASEFFKVTDQSVAHDRYKVLKGYLSQWIRMGRRGMHLMLDTQSPCISYDTEVYLRHNGSKKVKVEDAPEKFYIESFDFEKNKTVFKPAQKFEIGEKDVYKITLENGLSVEATSNHRFFNENNEEVFVEDLKVGDKLVYKRRYDKKTKKKMSERGKKITKEQIKKIEYVGKKKVYDISVEDTHNFFLANGILSHNSETKGLVDGQQDLTLLGRLPSEADRKQATEQLRKDGLITSKQIKVLASNEPGQFMFCPSGKNAYFTYTLLPRCRFWEEGNGNFYTIWKNEIDRWTSFQEEKERLEEKFKKIKKEIAEEKKEKKKKAEEKKRIEKENKKNIKSSIKLAKTIPDTEKSKKDYTKENEKENNSIQDNNSPETAKSNDIGFQSEQEKQPILGSEEGEYTKEPSPAPPPFQKEKIKFPTRDEHIESPSHSVFLDNFKRDIKETEKTSSNEIKTDLDTKEEKISGKEEEEEENKVEREEKKIEENKKEKEKKKKQEEMEDPFDELGIDI